MVPLSNTEDHHRRRSRLAAGDERGAGNHMTNRRGSNEELLTVEDLQPGDAVIIHTGWGRLWGKDNARYMKSNPGIGVAAAEWLAKRTSWRRKKAYEFAFVMQPLKLAGFTGSTVAPTAFR